MTTAGKLLRRLYNVIPEGPRFRVSTFRQAWRVKKALRELKPLRIPFIPSDGTMKPGMNVFGFLSAGLGLGEAARSTIRGANATGLPVSLFDIRLETHPVDASLSLESGKTFEYGINLFHFNPDSIELLWTEPMKRAYLGAQYNIGFWFWETQQLPDHWAMAADLFDEIWVGSAFCASTVRRGVSIPVIQIPLNVAPFGSTTSFTRMQLGLPEKGFLFLVMMDFYSRPERKNPFGAVEAFEKAFGTGSTDVCLIVKVTNSGISREFQKLKDLSRNNRRIVILDRFMNRSELQSLILNIDCMVSLHRAEGFGLTIAEAMTPGKPVIATDWSANMEFMTSQNSFPASYNMMTLNSYAPPYPKGTVWADPNIDEAANIMNMLVGNPALCREVGDRARADISSRFSAGITGQKILERLQEIQAKM